MAAEFIVIVVGVLVALGVDSFASWTHDRELEREYLERLLQDVDYDLGELAAVEAVAEAAKAYADSLLTSGVARQWEEYHLIGAVTLASNSREPDLSRSTFQELVNSGRIGLIRSPELRAALANYDRLFLEYVGFWDRAPPDFQLWVRSRVPNRILLEFRDSCGTSGLGAISEPIRVCRFDPGGWSAAGLRAELDTEEAWRLLNLQTWRVEGTLGIGAVFRDAAEKLRAIVIDQLRAAGRAL